MTALAALLLSLGGFASLALSMPKHHRQVFRGEHTTLDVRIRRIVGWLLLGVSLVLAVIGEGAAVGIVLWTGGLTAGALSVTILLTYWPRVIAVVAIGAPLSGAVLGTVRAFV